jgi:hypothetical protein
MLIASAGVFAVHSSCDVVATFKRRLQDWLDSARVRVRITLASDSALLLGRSAITTNIHAVLIIFLPSVIWALSRCGDDFSPPHNQDG